MAQAKADARRKGPRRSEASQAAILDATRSELSENGWRKFSVDKVAKAARASKQTIYRWWPSIGTMCVDAGIGLLPEAPREGRDPVERLSAVFMPLEHTARSGTGHAVLRAALMAAADDGEAGERWRAWLNEHMRTPTRLMLAELAAKRIIRRDWSIDLAMDIMLGPLWHRMLIMRAPIQEGYCQTQARLLLDVFAEG